MALSLKVATFNINTVNRRLPNLLSWLGAAKPDVVCLQELKADTRAFPIREVNDAGYHAVWQGQRTWNGVAILSKKEPVLIRRSLPGDKSDDQARYIEAAVGGPLIGCANFPNGNPRPGPNFEYKLAWMERLIKHSKSLLKENVPVVLAGDYNVVPDLTIDIYPTRSWDKDALTQPEPRARFQNLQDLGWLDSIRAKHPGERIYSYWSYLRHRWEKNGGLRLDHLLLSPQLHSKLIKAGVDREVRGEDGASDHAPAWITLR